MAPNYQSKSKFLVAGLTAVITLLLFSFSSRTPEMTTADMMSQYTADLNKAIISLDEVANTYKYGKIGIDSLQRTLARTRLNYKKIEFFLAFRYAEYVNEHINGAPLLHIERSGTRPLVVVPEGLQVLDELIFSETAADEKTAIASTAKKLRTNYSLLFENLNKKVQSNIVEVNAMRLQLVRVFSLGITGFDTPGSGNGLQEAEVSLHGMYSFFKVNYPDVNNNTTKEIVALFEGAIQKLHTTASFDSLDRLDFLKTYIDPLYKKLGTIPANTDAEFMENTTAWNPDSKSIFSADFLNPYFFTQLKKKDDNEQLKSLGKMLFYDPILSGDQKLSCASCHQPDKGFADAVPKSLSSIQGKTVLRNAPSLLNSVYADRYFYDLRAFSLEQQAEHVIFNSGEFNTAYSVIVKKLKASGRYNMKFKQVFGTTEVNRDQFSKALASYVLSLQSFNSPLDKFIRGETSEISQEVKNGFNLFTGKANCATCHFAPTFAGLVPPFYSDSESEILGVLADPKAKTPKPDADKGRWDNNILSERAWIYEKSFKTMTVRNADLTGPYFHNGAYETLDEVIEFYNKGGGEGLGLTVANQTLSAGQLNLTDKEKKELIAFIRSLNDVSAAR